MPSRPRGDGSAGPAGHQVYVFEQPVPIDPGKTLAAVTPPSLGDVAGCDSPEDQGAERPGILGS